jgi:hypothetical protein
MQAIITKYFSPTNSKPARIKASCPAGTIYAAFDHGLSDRDNHAVAAMTLVRKLGWHPQATEKNLYDALWACGEITGGYAFAMHNFDSFSYAFRAPANWPKR